MHLQAIFKNNSCLIPRCRVIAVELRIMTISLSPSLLKVQTNYTLDFIFITHECVFTEQTQSKSIIIIYQLSPIIAC